MKVGDRVTMDGNDWVVTWSSANMTDAERYQSHMDTADFMEQYGLSGDFQRHLAQRYKPQTNNL